MRICPKCGTKNKSQAKFCINCGYKFKPLSNGNHTESKLNDIKCPKCGKLNKSTSKFCKYCGAPLNEATSHAHVQSQQPAPKQQPQTYYTHQQIHESQRPVRQRPRYDDNYFTDYLNWLKNTLLHPLDQYSDNPFFGITSFGITAVLLWIAEYFSTSNGPIFNALKNFFSSLPGNSYHSIATNPSFNSPLWLLVITILTIAAYWLMDYVSDLILGHPKANVLFVGNHLAGLTNLTIITSAFVIFGALINSATVVWLFIFITKLIFLTGLFYAVESSITNQFNKHVSKLYLAMIICLATYIIQGVLVILVGNIFL